MSEIIIKNGHVFDAVTGLKGDVADVCIKDGVIVDKVSNAATVIDAAGKTVMAGAVDVHTHVAGPKVNLGRWYRPEDKFRLGERCSAKLNPNTRIEGGFSIPTVFKTGYEYARMGFAFTMEAAMRCTPATFTMKSVTPRSLIRLHCRFSAITGSCSST
jgi:formylmethanofuran dehydrogenase subunit A